MKLFSCIFLLACSECLSQRLTIDETISYINQQLYLNPPIHANKVTMELLNDGYLQIKVYPKSGFDLITYKTYYKNLSSSLAKDHALYLTCHNRAPCFQSIREDYYLKTIGRDNSDGLRFPYSDKYIYEKINNAINFLFVSMDESGKYKRNDDDDPFSPLNYKKPKQLILSPVNIGRIKLQESLGVYEISVRIGTMEKSFIVDSGASDVSISRETEQEFITGGIIDKNNYIEPALYKLADGTISKCRRFILPELGVGNFIIKNVTVSVGLYDAPLLLGKSFLDSFRKWSIDNNSKELILEK